ncbi:hypothetical protein [Streptomyces sp. NPDC060001]|uniref:hypothetical protein n=1 Tax=Streptomyces sp. NPDC060001 TaxID=3347032 RepID=UPI0036AE8C44
MTAQHDAIHNHFGLTYANYLVIPRTLLQSMDDEWQTQFVALLDKLDNAFAHIERAEGYKVEAATEHEVTDLDEEQQRQLGITEDWYRGETPPEGLSDADLAEWEAAHENPEGPVYHRDGEEIDGGDRVLLPAVDPVPHYQRGRARIAPKASEPASDELTFCTFGEDDAPGAGCILPAGHEPANRHVVTYGDTDDSDL